MCLLRIHNEKQNSWVEENEEIILGHVRKLFHHLLDFQIGTHPTHAIQQVPGRVWRTKSRLGSQSIVVFNLVRKMHLARSSSWKAGQTWRRINRLCQVPLRQHGKVKDWKTFCKNHDNVTPCVVPRKKHTCATLSGMGKHVAQRCTSPPGKCRKSLLAFFRITRLATSYVWRVKRKCKNSNLMHTRRYENGVKRLTTCEYVWTQLNIDERIWTHWTASDGINMRKHL